MILELKDLTKVYHAGSKRAFRAVDTVSFTLNEGEIISLIGESGSGKTTIGKMILKLSEPTHGQILYKDKDVTHIKSKNDKKEYYRHVQGVFQDPFSSFNPIFKADRIYEQVKREFFPDVAPSEWEDRRSISFRT